MYDTNQYKENLLTLLQTDIYLGGYLSAALDVAIKIPCLEIAVKRSLANVYNHLNTQNVSLL